MEENDHDILVELKRDMRWLKEGFSNHLKHHWIILSACFGAILSLSIGIILLVVKMVK